MLRVCTAQACLFWTALCLFVLVLGTPPASAQQGLVAFERDQLVLRTADGIEHTFDIELALTSPQQTQGLMYRQNLAEDAGMLFVYRPARHIGMWMRNTYIPLDMLFIAEDGEIVKVVQRTIPLSLQPVTSGQPVRAVLEVTGGTANRLGVRPRDRVVHPAFESGS